MNCLIVIVHAWVVAAVRALELLDTVSVNVGSEWRQKKFHWKIIL